MCSAAVGSGCVGVSRTGLRQQQPPNLDLYSAVESGSVRSWGTRTQWVHLFPTPVGLYFFFLKGGAPFALKQKAPTLPSMLFSKNVSAAADFDSPAGCRNDVSSSSPIRICSAAVGSGSVAGSRVRWPSPVLSPAAESECAGGSRIRVYQQRNPALLAAAESGSVRRQLDPNVLAAAEPPSAAAAES